MHSASKLERTYRVTGIGEYGKEREHWLNYIYYMTRRPTRPHQTVISSNGSLKIRRIQTQVFATTFSPLSTEFGEKVDSCATYRTLWSFECEVGVFCYRCFFLWYFIKHLFHLKSFYLFCVYFSMFLFLVVMICCWLLLFCEIITVYYDGDYALWHWSLTWVLYVLIVVCLKLHWCWLIAETCLSFSLFNKYRESFFSFRECQRPVCFLL